MPLKPADAIEAALEAKSYHDSEREQLDNVRRYWKGRQDLPAVIPSAAPREVKVMARLARVNICAIVVDTLAQSTFVDGFRAGQDSANLAVWDTWQANRMDARQTGIHRATFAYGAGYSTVLPGDRQPVIRGVSPRNMTALYGENPDWPMLALERMGRGAWRLYDETSIYYLAENTDGDFTYIDVKDHGAPVTPVVRFLDEDDLDADDDIPNDGEWNMPLRGQISPLAPIQDQIDLTTFGLLVAQWYSAFRQRWAIGWVAPNERDLMEKLLAGETDDPQATAEAAAAARVAARMQAGASQLWTFDESPEDMKLGEFDQTSLDGYIKSREASLRHAATLSQTPVHELIGELINLSAEALAAAEAGRDRKVDERKTLLGESHEQELWLAGQYTGIEIPDNAQVIWRETSARSFAATVDALGKLVQMLGIPPQELWERVPGATQQDVARWKRAAEQGDSFKVLADMLERQGAPAAA